MDTSVADELLAKGGQAAQAARFSFGPLRWVIEEWGEFTEKVKNSCASGGRQRWTHAGRANSTDTGRCAYTKQWRL